MSTYSKAPKTPSIEMFLKTKNKAIKLAKEKHKNQRYEDMPYIIHLDHVYETAKRLGVNLTESKLYQEILIACLLHDKIEDTDTKFEELENISFRDPQETLDSTLSEHSICVKRGDRIVVNLPKSYHRR